MNSTYFDLYGLRIGDIKNAKKLLENILSIEFEQRNSLYRCGDYYLFRSGENQESFLLQQNSDPFDDEWMEGKHGEYPLLLYVECTQRSSEIAALFEDEAEISLLRQRKL